MKWYTTDAKYNKDLMFYVFCVAFVCCLNKAYLVESKHDCSKCVIPIHQLYSNTYIVHLKKLTWYVLIADYVSLQKVQVIRAAGW